MSIHPLPPHRAIPSLRPASHLLAGLAWFAGPLLSAAPVAFTNTPENWAVLGGRYQFIPRVDNAGSGPLTFSAIQKPSWLSWNGSALAGTPPAANEGLNELVVFRVTNGDGEKADLNYRIRIGRMVGPVSSPPGGGAKQWATGMPAAARAGGDALLVTGVARAAEIPVFWGLEPSGFAMAMNCTSDSGAGGSDFSLPQGFTFAAGETGVWDSGMSTLTSGLGIWQGLTHQPASTGGGAVGTFLRADVTDYATHSTSLPLIEAEACGLDATVGALARVPAAGELRVNLRLHANAAHPSGSPALDWFNDLPQKLATDRTVTVLESGFYWVNTVPRLSANNGLSAAQGGSVVLTASMLYAADNEDAAQNIRIALGDGTNGGPPQHGELQRKQGSGWQTLGSGDSFTLSQLDAGEVRYVHDGSYETSDGFQFRVIDAHEGVARDGNYTVFTFPIWVNLVNHAPVAADQSLDCGVGATLTGVLDFSDADLGHMPQSIVVSTAATPLRGVFTITDPATGAFSYTSDGSVGLDTLTWQVSDGEFSSSATLTITVANQAPEIEPLELTGGNIGDLQGTLVVRDPDLPTQALTLSVVDAPAKGSVAIDGFSFAYTPAPGRFGADRFTVVATDSLGAVSAVQTVSVSLRPADLGSEAVFVTSRLPRKGSDEKEGAIQRVNPANGDVFTLATGLGQETRGLLWSQSLGKLLVLLEADMDGTPVHALVKVDPLTGYWGFDTLVAMNGELSFPISLAADGPDHVLVANGPGGVVRVALASGEQQTLDLGLPHSGFVASAAPEPQGPGIWVAEIGGLETPGDGTLYRCDRDAATAASPVSLGTAGDPMGLFPTDGPSMLIARSGLVIESIGLDPVSYVPADPPTTAPWFFPVTAVRSTASDAWWVADVFTGRIYQQPVAGGAVVDVTPEGVSSPFAVAMARGAGAIRVAAADGVPVESGALLDAGEAAITGGFRTLTLTLRNDGTAALAIGTAGLTGDDAADFTIIEAPESSLATGAEATLVIRFSPSAIGSRAAVLCFTTDDPSLPAFSLDLHGMGASAAALYESAASAAGLVGPEAMPSADPTGDGTPNLLKYAFGLSLVPGENESGSLPEIAPVETTGGPVLRMVFLRRKASGLLYQPEVSTDLSGFASATGSVTVTNVDDSWERVVVEHPCDPQSVPACFGRVRVTLP